MEYNKNLKKGLDKFYKSESKNIIYLCKNCSSSILINKINYDINRFKIFMECHCLCLRRKNITIKDYIDNFEEEENIDEINNDQITIVNSLKCYLHKTEFSYFCIDCEMDLCLNCIGEIHPNHTLITFDYAHIENRIKEIKDLIDLNNKVDKNTIKEKIKKSDFKIKEIDNHSKKELVNLFEKLGVFYSYYPCNNILKSIENIYNFCLNIKDFITESNPDDPIDLAKEKKIRFPRDLKNISENDKITSIIMIDKGIANLNGLKSYYDLSKLEIIRIQKDNIMDLSVLLNFDNLDNLKILDFEENKLTEENSEVFSTLKAPNLEFLDLFGNNFTTFATLKYLNRFKKLTKFFFGNNLINDKNCEEEYDCSNINEMGLSIGVFSEESIKRLSKFKLDNLSILYLNGNNIRSLEFLKDVRCDKLEEIWLMNNYIEDFSQLVKFKNLKIINLKDNKIKDISKLDEFVKEFTELKRIIISKNKIDTKDEKNIKIIENIRNRNIQIDIL